MPICPSKGLGIASRVSSGPLIACELRPASHRRATNEWIYFVRHKQMQGWLRRTSAAANAFADNPLILLICDHRRPIGSGQVVETLQRQPLPDSPHLGNIFDRAGNAAKHFDGAGPPDGF